MRRLSDAAWRRLDSLIPRPRRNPNGGRPRSARRKVVDGILHVLRTGCPWEDPPKEAGVSGITCWRWHERWTKTGLWRRIQEALLDELDAKGRLDVSRVAVDSRSIRAKRGARRQAKTPSIAAVLAPSTI